VEYWQRISQVDPENLVFLDEMGILMGTGRPRGRSKKGSRLYEMQPFYRGKKVTIMGAISKNKVIAVKMIEGSMKGEDFKKFLQEDVAPQLWEGATLVMDNLPTHKVSGVSEILTSVKAKIEYLSPYSPEFNPIEHWWWELKSFIRRFVPQTKDAVQGLLNIGVMLSSGKILRNYFAHCCYCHD
jgi:transposase